MSPQLEKWEDPQGAPRPTQATCPVHNKIEGAFWQAKVGPMSGQEGLTDCKDWQVKPSPGVYFTGKAIFSPTPFFGRYFLPRYRSEKIMPHTPLCDKL